MLQFQLALVGSDWQCLAVPGRHAAVSQQSIAQQSALSIRIVTLCAAYETESRFSLVFIMTFSTFLIHDMNHI